MNHHLFGYKTYARKKSRADGERAKSRKLEEMDRKSLIGILDRELSDFVRMTAIIKYHGYVPCCSCGTYMSRKSEMDCGHFITRGELSTRFDLSNLAPQCPRCNRFQGGMSHRFRKYLVNRDGIESVEALEAKAGLPCFLADADFVKMIKDYRAKNKALKKKIGEEWE